MKKVRIFLLLLSISLIFTGCSGFQPASSIDDLISPISPSGEYAELQKAMENYCKSSFSLKTPVSGDYMTSYIFYDLDGDSQDEALAFYELSGEPGVVRMVILNQDGDDGWSATADIEGAGASVNSVSFCDLNRDDTAELIILWDVIKNSYNHHLTVYQQLYRETLTLNQLGETLTVDNYCCVDINDDGANELMAFTIDQTTTITAKAVLYSFAENNQSKLGETKLDGHITTYKNIVTGKSDEGTTVYADAVKSDGTSMVTEVIYWSDYYDSIISPFYSYSTGLTSETTKSSVLFSRDLDEDDSVEIAVDSDLIESLPDGIYAHDWKTYKNTVLIHNTYSVSNDNDGYFVTIPDDLFSDISVAYDEKERVMTISGSGDEADDIFSIKPVLKTLYEGNEASYSDYSVILENSGYVYLAQINSESENAVTVDQLKNMIKS